MPPAEFLTGPAALDAIARARREAAAADGADPVDEAVTLRLKHHGLDGTGAWVTGAGFALRRGAEIDVVVAPAARRRGLGTRLAQLACAAPGELSAWSHGDHPAARSLAARLGFHRDRELWVMRRPTALPLPPAAPPPTSLLSPAATMAVRRHAAMR